MAAAAIISADGTKPPVHEPGGRGELRARILREATGVFARRGYAAASMREVAEAAQCTKPSLYYYFQSKEGLFLEVLRTETQAVTDLIQRAVAGGGASRERLRSGLELFFDHVRRNPWGLAVVLRAEVRVEAEQPAFDLASVRNVQIAMATQWLVEGIESGDLRPDVDVQEAVLCLIGMVDQRCRLYVFEGVPIPPDCPERVVDLFFRGVSR